MSHLSLFKKSHENYNPFLMMNSLSLGCGNESKAVEENYARFAREFKEPIFRRQQDLAIKFTSLKLEWEDDTLHLSSVTKSAMHPAYQRLRYIEETVTSDTQSDNKST